MEQMPEYKDGQVTLWKDGKWVQVPMSEAPVVEPYTGESDVVENSSDVPAGA